jgi:hypothetical protein
MKQRAAVRLGLLAIPAVVWGAPAVSGVRIDRETESSARVTWTTSNPQSQGIIHFGDSTDYKFQSAFPATRAGRRADRSWYVTGLGPGQIFYICVKETDGSGTSPCNGTGRPITFRTQAEKTPGPDKPEPPRERVDISLPPMTGPPLRVNPRDCNDPTDGLQALIQRAHPGQTILITPGQECVGAYKLPKKPGNGWIVIRSAAPDEQFPSPGRRIRPAHKPLLAVVRNNAPIARINAAPGGPCDDLWGYNRKLSGFPILRCGPGKTWSRVSPAGSGTSVPVACRPGEWFHKTDQPNAALSAWWCVAPDRYVPMFMGSNGNGETGSAFAVEKGAHHYRLIGLEITTVTPPPKDLTTGYPGLVHINPDNHHIIIDRCWLHGQDAPGETGVGVYISGRHIAVVDSYLERLITPRPLNNPGSQDGSNVFFTTTGPGPVRLENNYVSGVGITFFVEGGNPGPDPADFEVRGNYFYKGDHYRHGSPSSDGYYYWNRHHFELKRGRRFVIEGNIFEGNWANVNQGAMLMFSPRVGGSAAHPTAIRDILIRNNIIRNTPTGITLIGHETDPQPPDRTPAITQRIEISNNLLYNIDGRLVSVREAGAKGRFAVAFSLFWGPEDVVIRHNTVFGMISHLRPIVINHSTPDHPGSHAAIDDNVFPWAEGARAIVEGGGMHQASLEKSWRRYPEAGWTFNHNLIFGRSDQESHYPRSTLWAADAQALGFRAADLPRLALKAGNAYAHRASDGADPGVNLAELLRATARTKDGH